MEKKKCQDNCTPTPPMLVNELSRYFMDWMNRTTTEPLQGQHSCRVLLRSLRHMEGCTQLDLVHATHLKPPTVSVTLKKLEENGFVARKPDEHDLRATRVSLTAKGRALNESTFERCKQVDAIMMQDIAPEDIEVMVRVLTQMRSNILGALEGERENGNEAD